MKNMDLTQEDHNKRIKAVEEALKKALEENKVDLITIIDFPKYRELPDTVKLALAVLEQEGAIIVRKYIEKVDKKDL